MIDAEALLAALHTAFLIGLCLYAILVWRMAKLRREVESHLAEINANIDEMAAWCRKMNEASTRLENAERAAGLEVEITS